MQMHPNGTLPHRIGTRLTAWADTIGLAPHVRYLTYVLRHKWYVYQAGRVLGLPRARLLWHDATKFLPVEWCPYVRRFGGPNNQRLIGRHGYQHPPGEDAAFDRAWQHHWSHPWNRHHWDAYVIRRGQEPTDPDLAGLPMRMPTTYVDEMAADHYGAGMAQGKPDVWGWYLAPTNRMVLHPTSRRRYEWCLHRLAQAGLIPPRAGRERL